MSSLGRYVLWQRDPFLGRLEDPLTKWSNLKIVERWNTTDNWSLSSGRATKVLPAYGMVLMEDGHQVTSGWLAPEATLSRTITKAGPVYGASLAYMSDLGVIGDRIVLPDPAHAIGTAVTTFNADVYSPTGTVEDQILDLINKNAGPGALANRRVPGLRVPTSLHRGGTRGPITTRLDNLGSMVKLLATSGGLTVRIVHTEEGGSSHLDVVVTPALDVSADVRFGDGTAPVLGRVTTWAATIRRPTGNAVFVAGGGDGAARIVLQLRDEESISTWGRSPVELLVDQRQVNVDAVDAQDQLTAAGLDALLQGSSPATIVATVEETRDVVYREDFEVGYRVGVDVAGLSFADRVQQVTTTVNGAGHRTREIVVGTLDAGLSILQRQVAQLNAAAAQERGKR